MKTSCEIGCLIIDEPLQPVGALKPLAQALHQAGIRTAEFVPRDPRRLHLALQNAYQQVRRDDAVNGIVALGSGCDCALALASQLPTDRLALLEPLNWRSEGELGRQLGRVRRYARRGAAFCVSDVLILPGPCTDPDLPERLRRALCNSRVALLEVPDPAAPEGKELIKTAILHFLRHGVLPKSLAENPEMCIIYG